MSAKKEVRSWKNFIINIINNKITVKTTPHRNIVKRQSYFLGECTSVIQLKQIWRNKLKPGKEYRTKKQ